MAARFYALAWHVLPHTACNSGGALAMLLQLVGSAK